MTIRTTDIALAIVVCCPVAGAVAQTVRIPNGIASNAGLVFAGNGAVKRFLQAGGETGPRYTNDDMTNHPVQVGQMIDGGENVPGRAAIRKMTLPRAAARDIRAVDDRSIRDANLPSKDLRARS